MAKQDLRPLMLKIRVSVTRRMKGTTLRKKIQQALRTGYVPEGIEIHWMDWRKGTGGKASEGRIPGAAYDELQRFYNAMKASTIRMEIADD